MNILLAPDSYKGSLTSLEASTIMKKAIASALPESIVEMKPMADGGEGTVDVLVSSAEEGKYVPITCTGPLGNSIETYYGIIRDEEAIIEVANIAGLVQVPDNERNPDHTTTYGIGEVILDAVNRGCTSIIIGLGGSATNDGGFGLLQALGMKAWGRNGKCSNIYGGDIHTVDKIDAKDLDPRLKNLSIKVACDVNNPLCGVDGATEVYGRQKGATEEQVAAFDRSLNRYKDTIQTEEAVSKTDKADKVPGAGAAGGLGFALLGIGADLVSGSELIASVSRMEEALQTADLVITGEGQSDEQTLFGKAPAYVADLASKHDVPTVLLSGALTGDITPLRSKFAGCFSIANRPLSLGECVDNAGPLLSEQTKQLVQFAHTMTKLNVKQ